MPAPKPLYLPEFASGLDAAIVEPLAGQKASGWLPGTAPPAEAMNWLHNGYYRWAAYLDTFTENALTWSAAQTFSAGITASANVNITAGGLTVVGTTSVTGGGSLSGGLSVGQDLSVGASASVDNALDVGGVLTAGSVSANGSITTPGNISGGSLTGPLTIEAPRLIGATGQPSFVNGYEQTPGALDGISYFYKDPAGRVWVHLVLRPSTGAFGQIIVTLPELYRPTIGVEWLWTNILVRTDGITSVPIRAVAARVNQAGQIWLSGGGFSPGDPLPATGSTIVAGSFRAV